MKPLEWYPASKKALDDFPMDVKSGIGFNLHRVQSGLEPLDWKPLNGLGKGITGVYEIRHKDENNIYRVAYVAKFEKAIVVLHCWQKKTEKTSASDLELIANRFREIKDQYK